MTIKVIKGWNKKHLFFHVSHLREPLIQMRREKNMKMEHKRFYGSVLAEY